MLKTLFAYQAILENLEEEINLSPYKKQHFIDTLEISRGTFYNKLKNKSFTLDELVILGGLINPEEAKAMTIKQALAESREDSNAGRVKSHDEVMKAVRERIKS